MLLIDSAVITTLGLIVNSTIVVIGVIIVVLLMDPFLSYTFGPVVSNKRLTNRSAMTELFGVVSEVGTARLLAAVFGACVVN